MTCRRHGSKPTLALWMLVAVADIALIAATAGLVAMLLFAVALVTVAAAVIAVRQVARQASAGREPVAAPLTARRRA